MVSQEPLTYVPSLFDIVFRESADSSGRVIEGVDKGLYMISSRLGER